MVADKVENCRNHDYELENDETVCLQCDNTNSKGESLILKDNECILLENINRLDNCLNYTTNSHGDILCLICTDGY